MSLNRKKYAKHYKRDKSQIPCGRDSIITIYEHHNKGGVDPCDIDETFLHDAPHIDNIKQARLLVLLDKLRIRSAQTELDMLWW